MKKTKKMGEMTFRYDFFYQFLTFIERRTPGGGALFSAQILHSVRCALLPPPLSHLVVTLQQNSMRQFINILSGYSDIDLKHIHVDDDDTNSLKSK